MMSSATLYTYPNSFRSYKALIAAQYSGFKLDVTKDFIMGEANKTEQFLTKFPVGKVPALETSDKQHIYESNAIAYYVANEQLRGKTILDQAQILQWVNFADNEILPSACTWLFPCLGVIQYNKQATEKAKEDLKKCLQILNEHLLTRTFLVGERITLADITVCCYLLGLYRHVLEPSFRAPYANTNRWFVTLINQPEFKTVFGEFTLCTSMAQFDSKKYAELHQKSPKDKGGKVQQKSKEESQKPKPKEAQKGKEKTKEQSAEDDEQPDETEMILAAEQSAKDPFADFPKGTFVMDDFKRVYSNEEEAVSIKYFWEKFDSENYSIWYCEYLYPQELTLTFMSCNLISGMFQRLDKMRKNAFGSVILFGEDNNSTISGIWIWRGPKLAFELSEDWQIDYESYSWKKLDPASMETKKMVNEYFSWSGDFGGKKFKEGKIFK